MKINTISLIILFAISYSTSIAQSRQSFKDSIVWEQLSLNNIHNAKSSDKVWNIDKGENHINHPEIPRYSKIIPIPKESEASVQLKILSSSAIDLTHETSKKYVNPETQIQTNVIRDKNQYFLGISFIPIVRKYGEQYEKIEAFQLDINLKPKPSKIKKVAPFVSESVLKDGGFYKLGIQAEGIYSIDYSYLQDTLQLDLSNINPSNISVFGNGGRQLPENNSSPRIDDLIENAILVTGAEDGRFDIGDKILFYGQATTSFGYDKNDERFYKEQNPYANQSFYYLSVNNTEGKRIQNYLTSLDEVSIDNTTNVVIRHEQELSNLLGVFGATQGSGQRWLGEDFTNQRSFNFTSQFDFTDIDLAIPVSLDLAFLGRASSSTTVRLNVDRNTFSQSIRGVKTEDVEAVFAREALISESFNLSSDSPQIEIDYPRIGDLSAGWLDYLQLTFEKNIKYSGAELTLFNKNSLQRNKSGFRINNGIEGLLVWDITDDANVKEVLHANIGNEIEFGYEVEEQLKVFKVFDLNSVTRKPKYISEVASQNLHAIQEADMLVIYHPEFEEAAERIADHRKEFSNLNVVIASTNEVYNEFSSGIQDPTALRDFAKMIYERDPNFNFLLLIGDGSYDFRHINKTFENQSFVPPYETKESLNPLTAFPTDDYFALLNDNEGGSLRGAIDIAVGRLPARTNAEALAMVDKIIAYETEIQTNGDWKLRIAFSADDEDSNIHLNQADNIAKAVQKEYPVYNQEKIYFDAFSQVSTPGGARYPDATQKLNNEIFKGLLMLNYLGHGGSKGWSQERVLKTTDINEWDNANKLPLIITATCSFTGFDDPALTTGGEEAILNPKGGAVALFSTVRSVYSSQNFRLTKSVFDTIFTIENGNHLPIGEILRRAKNSNSADTINVNARKFLLIGDPAMQLAIPEYNIRTSSINGKNINQSETDTLRALQKISITGEIVNETGTIVSDFNGTIYPTLYDKEISIETLSNDVGSPKKKFGVQRNILFSGTASVTNGKFSTEFVIPKDINYNFGNGKMSYYATDDNQVDAAGYFDQLIIGGTDSTILQDNSGPSVQLYMNNENFVSGGITNADPNLIVQLVDENGINFSGTSIGHDITAVLDENTQETIILNDFYKSEKDDFTKGNIRYPLKNIAPGKHTLTVKAFDVANNVGEGILEFFVSDNSSISLERVLNYPNPFTTHTEFMFEHNLQGNLIDIIVSIYTISGKLIKTITKQSFADGFREDNIIWDGTDDYGNQLGRGIYLYQIKINSEDLKVSKKSDFEKLLLLR